LPADIRSVSCVVGNCTYVGRSGSRPLIYQGTGLHPVRQAIP
jgi:hypothetical protein